MKIALFTGPRRIEIADAPQPTIRQPDEVLVRIDRVGICGSDVYYYTRGGIGRAKVQYPSTLGHECSGTIVETGSHVRSLKPGDRVAIDPAISCGACDQCQAGRVHTCRNIQFMGYPGQATGAAAEFCVLPAINCLPITPDMTLDQAVLVEPLAIGLHAVRLAEVFPASRVGIFGCGPIGLSVLMVSKAAAPSTVYAADLLDERLKMAGRLGADFTSLNRSGEAVTTFARREPTGLDIVFDCSGDPQCIDQAQELLTPGGTLMIVGIPVPDRVEFDVHRMRAKELTFHSCRRQKGCVAPVIRMMDQKTIRPDAMLTHHFPLERIQDAFELVAGYQDGVVKAVVDLS